jgi:hypothetical protein
MSRFKFVASITVLFPLIGWPDPDGEGIGALVGTVLGIALLLTEPKVRQSRGFNARRRWRGHRGYRHATQLKGHADDGRQRYRAPPADRGRRAQLGAIPAR